MQYSQELIEEVRSRNDIVDVIGEYVHLQKKGSSYMGLCPFHNEKSPSFSVSGSKQMYHCFGCGAGGDVFTFLMKYDNLTFGEAIKELAQRGGITLPDEDDSPAARKMRDKRQILLDINKEAAKYYYFQLRSEKGKTGYEYFKKRELTDETMQKFGLGFSNVSSSDLVRYLKTKGYREEQIIEAGLATHDEKFGTHDKFWNRVMFPIQDVNQKVVGFGGRVMGDGKPKYLNSPETMIFDKSHNLYGLNYAKNARAGHMIICEGYMDVIAMHQAGFSEAVASLGTAFTSGQAQILKRYTDEVILSYDSDGAGIKAAMRGIGILKEAGLQGKVLNLEPYKDPDEFIKAEGGTAFAERLKNAENTFFFELRILQQEYDMNDPAAKTAFYREIAKKLCEFEEAVERENYLQAVAVRYNIAQNDLRSLVGMTAMASAGGIVKPKPVEKPKSGIQTRNNPEDASLKPQRVLLTWIADEPKIYGQIRKYISVDDFTDELYRHVAERMFAGMDAGSFLPASIVSMFPDEEQQRKVAEIFNTNLVQIETRDEKEKALHDIIMDVKSAGYNRQMQEMSLDDANALQKTIAGKKLLEELAHTKISLGD